VDKAQVKSALPLVLHKLPPERCQTALATAAAAVGRVDFGRRFASRSIVRANISPLPLRHPLDFALGLDPGRFRVGDQASEFGAPLQRIGESLAAIAKSARNC